MAKLARLFLSSIRTATASSRADLARLETVLATMFADARAQSPALSVSEAAFVAHLGRCVPADTDPGQALAKMNAADLYLAKACLDGVPGAADVFQERYRAVIAKALARIQGGSDLVREVTQALFTRLLVSSPGKPSALADYQGRSALAHFVGITAQRLALNDRRAGRARRRLLDRLAEHPPSSERNPEQHLLRQQYRRPFEAALREAVARLSGRERVVMKLHLCGGLSTVRIAKMYQVNQATVSRWLSHARQVVWDEVRARLNEELGLATSEVESMLRSVRAEIDLSLSEALATEI